MSHPSGSRLRIPAMILSLLLTMSIQMLLPTFQTVDAFTILTQNKNMRMAKNHNTHIKTTPLVSSTRPNRSLILQMNDDSKDSSSSTSTSSTNENSTTTTEKETYQYESNKDTIPPIKTNDATLQQKAEAILYRLTLLSATTALATSQILHLLSIDGISGGAGLPMQVITNLQSNSNTIFTWGILLSALFAPSNLDAITDDTKDNDVNNALFLLLNELLPTLACFAIFIEIVHTIQGNLADGTTNIISAKSVESLDQLSTVFISLICFREIGFFGASYKAEAILGILLCIVLSLNDWIGYSEPILSGSLSLCLFS